MSLDRDIETRSDRDLRRPWTRGPGREVVPPPAAVSGPRLEVAEGFDLDVVRRELRHNGQPIHLRPREYDLLVVLASYPGRAFTRAELIDLAWDVGGSRGPRTVDVHVHWLRGKLEATPSRPRHLVTIRGYGYRLDP